MATYAIGDVHGCYATLEKLFSELPFDRRQDRLWMVGDLVNRGPCSLAVLRWARALESDLGERMTVVLGNHDVHLLALAAGLGKPHHRESLADVLEAADAEQLVGWLRRRPLLVREEPYLLVHAGLLPQWSAAAAERSARLVEEVLRRPEGVRLLLGLGDEKDSALDPARKAFRVLTRIRTVTATGELCGHTGPPATAPAGCVPWFDAEDRRSRDHVVVCGHWAALGRVLRPDVLALDSGCVYGGELTAVRLDDHRVFAQPSREVGPKPTGDDA